MAVTAATAKTVRERERGRCQLCNFREFEEGRSRFALHHVRPKSMGGTSDPERDYPDHLALLHDLVCHPWVHENRREARALGLIESRLGQVRPSALIRRPA